MRACLRHLAAGIRFVEKPLAMNDVQLDTVLEAAKVQRFVDGRFNRRFSPHANEVRERFKIDRSFSIIVIV